MVTHVAWFHGVKSFRDTAPEALHPLGWKNPPGLEALTGLRVLRLR
jgi:hypothetical protein